MVRVAAAFLIAIVAASGGGADDGPRGLIAFSAITNGPGYQQIYVADLGTGTVTQLTHGADGGYDPSWSPDGAHIAFEWPSTGPCHSPACSRIFIVDADGANRHPFTPGNVRAENAAWSPTGDRIAYSQWRGGYRASIYTRTLDGTVVRVTHGKDVFDSFPVWSPDGTRIVFSREDGVQSGNYVVNADGSGLRRLDGNPATFLQSWSPDGRLLVGSRTWGRYNNRRMTVVVAADGSHERRLLGGGGGPVWSPDGMFVAFVPDEQDLRNGTIGVIRADGTGRKRLVGGSFSQPAHLDWLRR